MMKTIKNIADQLRSVMVREWIENSLNYEQFLVDVCIKQEATKFLTPMDISMETSLVQWLLHYPTLYKCQ